MARRNYHDPDKIDPQVTQSPTIDLNTLEIRGQGKKWHLSYPDESNISTRHPVIDKEGRVISYVEGWVATNQMTEVHEVFESMEEAKIAANFIHPGCEIKVIKTTGKGGRKKKVDNDD